MSDRALLEAAAKAAGIDIDLERYDDSWGFAKRKTSTWWNPLADDGDALRLAVKLGIDIRIIHPRDRVELGRSGAGGMWNLHDDDPCSATRRAITRAAASIGSGKESAS